MPLESAIYPCLAVLIESSCQPFERRQKNQEQANSVTEKGQYSLTVAQQESDGDLFQSGGNFTDSESASFGGDCHDPNTDPKREPPACVDATLTLKTDSYPLETSVNLTDVSTGEIFWADTVFESNTLYEWSKCIDPEGCHRLVVGDSYGDGLFGDGLNLTYDGELLYSGGFSGKSFERDLGDGC